MPVFPLGAHVEDGGVRFAVASTSADAVEVCLVDGPDGELTERRVALTERTFGVWHGHVPGVGAGQRYGYRVHGPYRPWTGVRANPAKILVDPYARRIVGRVTDLEAARGWVDDPMTGVDSTVDSLGHVPLSVVTAPDEPAAEPRPDVPWSETVILEAHVRGWTKLHPEVPAEHRGTYLGMAHPAVVEHLTQIGVTAVELLPVTSIADEPPLAATRGDQLLGLRHAGLPRPARRVRERAGRGDGGVPDDGGGPARRGHRGDPRRGAQPHRGGRRRRHHALLPRPRRAVVLLAGRQRPRRRHHRLRQHPRLRLARR